MKIRIYYETLNGEKKVRQSEMNNSIELGENTYFDYYKLFKRCDKKIKEDYFIVVYNDGKIIHKEKIHIHWITYPWETQWIYGITLCGNRVVTEVRYGHSLPICDKGHIPYIIVQDTDSEGNLLYDSNGLPITHRKLGWMTDPVVKKCNTSNLPRSIINKLYCLD